MRFVRILIHSSHDKRGRDTRPSVAYVSAAFLSVLTPSAFVSNVFCCHHSLQNMLLKNLRNSIFHTPTRPSLHAGVSVRHAKKSSNAHRRAPVRPLRLLNFSKLCDFLMPEKWQKSTPRLAVRAPLGCNGVLPALQRRPRCNTTRPSLQPRKGLTADQSGPDATSIPWQN